MDRSFHNRYAAHVPRHREFDADRAVDAALDVFWERGYEATSMQDLGAATGLSRSSLYGTFGSKHGLFLHALRRYLEAQRPSPVEMLSQPGPVLPAIEALLAHYAAASEDPRGCMLVNSAAELLPHDQAVAQIVQSSWDTISVALRTALIRARSQGEIPPDADPAELADFLLVVLQGLRLVGKGSRDRARLRSAALTSLRAIAT